jgi:hypothetical protein
MRTPARRLFSSSCLAALVTVMSQEGAAQPPGTHYDEAKVPAYTLPDPLRLANGEPVQDARAWRERRRPEVLKLFETYVYGRSPGPPAARRSEVTSVEPRALGGKAVRKEVAVLLDGRTDGPRLNLLLYLPTGAGASVPAFLALNFGGNHTLSTETGIALPRGWMPTGEPGVVDHRATEAGRGRDASAWPVEKIVGAGFALVTAYYGDLEPDFDEGWKQGIRSTLGPTRGADRPPDDWGALAAWAWGLRRALDALEDEPAIDAKRVALMGHSRLGKAALWAGAQDERFALVISNESGEGGAALSRRRFGETVAAINNRFPHWFCANYKKYNDREDELPVDQHLLLALVAPRPLYVASAAEDLWADPRGEFLAAKAAGSVYRLLGRDGLGVSEPPPLNQSVGNAVAYHNRAGQHAVTTYDWEQYLAFASRWLKALR